MGLEKSQKRVLFYSLLTVILVVSLAMCVALYRHFVMREKVGQINFVLAIFAVEIIGCFVLGWKHVVASPSAGEEIPPEKRTTLIVRRDREDHPPADEVEANWKARVQVAVGFLSQARDVNLKSPTKRKRFLRQASAILEKIPPTSKYHMAALYDLATVRREEGRYEEALRLYDTVDKAIPTVFKDESPETQRKRRADILLMKARVYDVMPDRPRAKELYLSSWELNPTDYNVALNLFELCKDVGELEEAAIWYSVLSSLPEHETVLKGENTNRKGKEEKS